MTGAIDRNLEDKPAEHEETIFCISSMETKVKRLRKFVLDYSKIENTEYDELDVTSREGTVATLKALGRATAYNEALDRR